MALRAFLFLPDRHTRGEHPSGWGGVPQRAWGTNPLLSVCVEDPEVPVTLRSGTRLFQFSHRGPGPGSGQVEF